MCPNDLTSRLRTNEKKMRELFARGEAMTAEELAEFDTLTAESDALNVQIVQARADEASRIEAQRQRGEAMNRITSTIDAPENRRSRPLAAGNALSETVRVEVTQDEADKNVNFRDFLTNLRKAKDPTEGAAAHARLTGPYGSMRTEDYYASQKRTLTSKSGAAGGYLMPRETRAELLSLAAESAVVRPRASKITLGADRVPIPMLGQYATPSSDFSGFLGGMNMAWTAENSDAPDVEPNFKEDELVVHDLMGYTEVPNNLLNGAVIDFDAMLRQLFAQGIAWAEDFAFLRGNGTGKPLGVAHASNPGLVYTAARGSATAISFANARAVWVKTIMSCRNKAVFIGSQGAEDKILDMAGTANSVFIPSGYFVTPSGGPNPSAAGQPISYMLLGREVIITEKLPALNSLGDFGLYDLSKYLIGDRDEMFISTSEHYKFKANKTCYRVVHRVAGIPWPQGAVTLADGTTTVGAFVQLQVQ